MKKVILLITLCANVSIFYALQQQGDVSMKPDMVYPTISTSNESSMLKSLEPIVMTKASTKNERTLVIEPQVVIINQTNNNQSFTMRIGGAEAQITQIAQSITTYEILPVILALSETFAVNEAPQPVSTIPDSFDIEPVEIFLSGELKAGEEITASRRVLNVRKLPTPPNATLFVQFFLEGGFEVARSTTCIPSIKPGGEFVVKANVPCKQKLTWTAEKGHHMFFSRVQIGNCYPERNTDNNISV